MNNLKNIVESLDFMKVFYNYLKDKNSDEKNSGVYRSNALKFIENFYSTYIEYGTSALIEIGMVRQVKECDTSKFDVLMCLCAEKLLPISTCIVLIDNYEVYKEHVNNPSQQTVDILISNVDKFMYDFEFTCYLVKTNLQDCLCYV